MPIVLSTAEGAPRAGYTYDDRTGVSYEFPTAYAKLVQPGERFLYHQPRKGYTGAGIVGAVVPSALAGRLVCEVLDYEKFDVAIPIKNPHGDQWEADPTYWKAGKVYWSKGVRPLAEDRYEAILVAAGSSAPPPVAKAKPRHGYASPRTSKEVDEYAISVALNEVARIFPGEDVDLMPHNNPGFDIRVGTAHAPTHYVEVKGTMASEPVFFLSEGERKFSERNATNYTMLVVQAIDLKAKSHSTVRRHDGAVNLAVAILEPTQWRGQLL